MIEGGGNTCNGRRRVVTTAMKRSLCSVWCGGRPRIHFDPRNAKLSCPIQTSTVIPSHIRTYGVIPNAVPEADICFTRGVFIFVPLSACGPNVCGSFSVVHRIKTRHWTRLGDVISCPYGMAQTTITSTQAYNRNARYTFSTERAIHVTSQNICSWSCYT